MNEPLAIANLKANKNWDETLAWLEQVAPMAKAFSGTVILCPSAPFIASAAITIRSKDLKIELGAQDISMFEQGPYTGEVAASQIADLVKYTIIGHSERRTNLREDDAVLAQKAKNAKSAGIEPIFCVQNAITPIPPGAKIVAYEPVFAIGTGKADTPEDAGEVAAQIKSKGDYTVVYGGSVTAENAASFIKKSITGVLVASASQDPKSFNQILNAIK